MKNFDEGRRRIDPPMSERQFQLRGHTFTRRARIAPEAAAVLEDAAFVGTAVGTLDEVDRGVLMFLIPEDADMWRKLRDPDGDDPLLIEEMTDVSAWLLESEARRPTTAPSGSSDGRDATNGTSTDGSSSPESTRTA